MFRKQGLPGKLAKVLKLNADGEYTSVLLSPPQAPPSILPTLPHSYKG